MGGTRRSRAFSFLLLGTAVGLSGCIGTVREQVAVAGANVRATRPLTEWVDVLPEHLAEVDPARLEGEGAALVIGRGLKETGTGERSGTLEALILRDVLTSAVHESPVQKTGTEAEVGWSVLLVPPGQYIVNRSITFRRTAINRATGQLKESIIDVKGHPYVPLSSTIHIGAGDVVYVGTVVARSGPNVEPYWMEVRDERAAAAAWTRDRLPAFGPRLQTRLLPKPIRPLS